MILYSNPSLYNNSLQKAHQQVNNNPNKSLTNCIGGHEFENAVASMDPNVKMTTMSTWYYDMDLFGKPVDTKMTHSIGRKTLIVEKGEFNAAESAGLNVVYVFGEIMLPKGVDFATYIMIPQRFEFNVLGWALTKDYWVDCSEVDPERNTSPVQKRKSCDLITYLKSPN